METLLKNVRISESLPVNDSTDYWYWYNITDKMQVLFGNSIKFAEICVSYWRGLDPIKYTYESLEENKIKGEKRINGIIKDIDNLFSTDHKIDTPIGTNIHIQLKDGKWLHVNHHVIEKMTNEERIKIN